MTSNSSEPPSDQLQSTFSGPALQSLQQLGVTAYNAADLELNSQHVLDTQRSARQAKRTQIRISQIRKEIADIRAGKAGGDIQQLQDEIESLQNGKSEEDSVPQGIFAHQTDIKLSVKRVAAAGESKRTILFKDDDDDEKPIRKRTRAERTVDDADDFEYQQRLQKISADTAADAELDVGYRVPGRIYDRLFYYQRQGLMWLWELHKLSVGGIVADAMGLGKTVTIIAFLSAIANSNMRLGPSLILCPASIMGQWLAEFRHWWPESRIMLLHDSGNHMCSPQKLISRAFHAGTMSVVITTYESLRKHHDIIIPHRWGYVILDEGHRIRNPDAAITLLVKRVRTPHRVILSGSPIQNHLRELWSLFDFIFPGKLGTLPVFEEEFCEPIVKGGYIHASKQQTQLAYQRAVLLRDMITPHILRRLKSDVLKYLPQKSEQILFCSLTSEQKSAYRLALAELDVNRFRNSHDLRLFQAISVLRKICNHPDLLNVHADTADKPSDYGACQRSGKLKVTQQILSIWKQESHRVLLFSQTRQCLNIIESMVKSNGYDYRRVDGSTAVRSRQAIFDEFNQNRHIFVLLLTTRAGGFGLNLTGADRVLVYDPDWNPATDEQAQERAYRIGQTRDVSVLRLVTRGTIEEKVYHRQIFKQLLTNKILEDPVQQRFFSNSDLKDLFSYVDDGDDPDTTTADIFRTVDLQSSEPSTAASSDLLRCLFDNADLSSVFSHDRLVASQSAMKIRESSVAVATKAIESLRSSQVQSVRSRIGVPTWTGKNGNAGLPALDRVDKVVSWLGRTASSSSSSQPATGSSAKSASQQLLDDIRGGGHAASAGSFAVPADPKAVRLLHDMTAYLRTHPAGVKSDKIIGEFQSRIGNMSDQYIFKHLLKHIAVLEGKGSSRLWTLKSKFEEDRQSNEEDGQDQEQ